MFRLAKIFIVSLLGISFSNNPAFSARMGGTMVVNIKLVRDHAASVRNSLFFGITGIIF